MGKQGCELLASFSLKNVRVNFGILLGGNAKKLQQMVVLAQRHQPHSYSRGFLKGLNMHNKSCKQLRGTVFAPQDLTEGSLEPIRACGFQSEFQV